MIVTWGVRLGKMSSYVTMTNIKKKLIKKIKILVQHLVNRKFLKNDKKGKIWQHQLSNLVS